METRSFDVICPPDDPEIKLRYRIWKAFEDFGGDGRHIPEYRMRNTICCPWTSDIRLDHKSGTSIFIELKEKHARVSADQKTFSHLASGLNMPGKGIFTFRAPWDYILTMVDDDTGYLMIKEDIPKDWWHNYPGGDGWLTHVYPNNVLLSSRRVSLNQPAWDIVRNIRRIIIGTRIPGDPPVKSRMTAKDICRLAGPCHMALLSKDYMDRMGLDDDDAGADEGAAGPHAARALATRGQADDGEPEEAEGRRRGAFGTVPVEDRYKLVGGLDATVDAQLFMPLMDECRRT